MIIMMEICLFDFNKHMDTRNLVSLWLYSFNMINIIIKSFSWLYAWLKEMSISTIIKWPKFRSRMVPIGPYVKSLAPQMTLLGVVEPLGKWVLPGGLHVFGGVSLKRVSCLIFSFSSPFYLLFHPSPDVSGFALSCALHSDMLPCHRSKCNWINWPWSETSKTRTHKKPFVFISWLFQIFVIVTKKLTYIHFIGEKTESETC
jgi:hypothetical protein